MTTVTYEIVEHDGGWAYRVGDVYSETFASHDEARHAADRAAAKQAVAGKTIGISYEDTNGQWHQEVADGTDRPQTEVNG